MIASIEKKFVLLSNPKTGTTALESCFGRFANIRVGNGPKYKHMNYFDMREVFGSYFDDFRIYAVVRDPIDTLVSWYKYRSRDDLGAPTNQRHRNYTGRVSFEDFIEAWARPKPPRYAKVPSSVSWCLSEEGALAPLVYYRYESIDALFDVLAEHVGKRPAFERRNVSPPREVAVDREAAARLPKMQKALEVYATIPFVR